MKHQKTFYGIAVAIVSTLVFCSNDTLFDPDRYGEVTANGFSADTLLSGYALEDTAGRLVLIATTSVGKQIFFIGIVSPSDAPVDGSWDFGDGHSAQEIIAAHTYAKAGNFLAVFTITDRAGNTFSDTVAVYVSRQSSIAALQPLPGQRNIIPSSATGLRVAWTGGRGTTTFFLDTTPQLSTPRLTGITDTTLVYKGDLLEQETYFWRVIVRKSASIVDTSPVFQFHTGESIPVEPDFRVEAMGDTGVKLGDTLLFTAKAVGFAPDTVVFRWDFNNDGVWDDTLVTRDTVISTRYRYPQPGTYTAILSAHKQFTKQSAVDTVKITVSSGSPIIQKIRPDTTVLVGDSVHFSATGIAVSGSISEYAWDFDGNGTSDFTSRTTATSGYRYRQAGTYRAILTVKNSAGMQVRDTVVITAVAHVSPRILYLTPNTVAPFGAAIVCSVAVAGGSGAIKIEIDTANTGTYKILSQNSRAISYRFVPWIPSISFWDSVKVRVTDGTGAQVTAGFKVDIIPRALTISAIDSTTSTISVRHTLSGEDDFLEYRIYRSVSNVVDTTSELWAKEKTKSNTVSVSAATYDLKAYYYRIYQVDNEGLISGGSNIVRGAIRNTPVQAPSILVPATNNISLWATDTIRWRKALDPNATIVTYTVSVSQNGSPFQELAANLTDTTFVLSQFAKTGFTGHIRISAQGNPGDNASSTRSNIVLKAIVKGSMKLVRSGSFTDARGMKATVSKSFWIDSTEISQGMYRELIKNENPSAFNGRNNPVENVTWYQAIMYCNARSKAEGLDTVYAFIRITATDEQNLECHWDRTGYRLPTADEWELAAHAGAQFEYGTRDGTIGCDKANYAPCGSRRPVAIGSYAPTPWGHYDLAGNVAEWCWDKMALLGAPNNRIDYTGGTTGSRNRVVRGGSYITSSLDQLRASYLTTERADRGNSSVFGYVGFRCARTE